METIDLLDAVKAELDEQRKRYMAAYLDALGLGDLSRTDEKEEFDRIEKGFHDLREKCRKKENEIEPLREQNKEEYVSQMVELCDEEAKAFSKLTGDLKALVHEVNLRRASMSLSNMGLDRKK
jgi:hypothetical protein